MKAYSVVYWFMLVGITVAALVGAVYVKKVEIVSDDCNCEDVEITPSELPYKAKYLQEVCGEGDIGIVMKDNMEQTYVYSCEGEENWRLWEVTKDND